MLVALLTQNIVLLSSKPRIEECFIRHRLDVRIRSWCDEFKKEENSATIVSLGMDHWKYNCKDTLIYLTFGLLFEKIIYS